MSTNKFASKCRRCGQIVPAGEGVAAKTSQGWQVTHLASCPVVVVPGRPAREALASVGLGGYYDRRDFERDPDEGDRG